MKNAFLRACALALVGCASQTAPAVVEIPPQPPPLPTHEPDRGPVARAEPPPPTPVVAAAPAETPPADEGGPWSQGLPPAAGPSPSYGQAPPPRPLITNQSCSTPFWYDAQGVKHYNPACYQRSKTPAPVPTITSVPPRKPFPSPPPLNFK